MSLLEQGQKAEMFTDLILGLETDYWSYFTTHVKALKETQLEIQGFSFWFEFLRLFCINS